MILLIFPHQLFLEHPGLKLRPSQVMLVEDPLFFGDQQYPAKFHQQKLWLHRASMKRYQHWLVQKGFGTTYVEYRPQASLLRNALGKQLESLRAHPRRLLIADVCDHALEKRLRRLAHEFKLPVQWLASPGFLNERHENQTYRKSRKRWFQTDFYRWQRKRMNLLMKGDQPLGGKWTFDVENRKKVPRNLISEIPQLPRFRRDAIDRSAVEFVEKQFPSNPGELSTLVYPTSHQQANRWLQDFLKSRFARFGPYEDAIVENENWLWHSVLTPSLNIGLLTPGQVLEATQKFATQNSVPIQSLEGFVRQIVGWREFIRATYEDLGVRMRTGNHWDHQHPMPAAFYSAETGVAPVDNVIQRVLQTGYCHHIERLMVLGGFMFLCEVHPVAIYRWFMELFIDSYDWVMVPNVYSMSQHAAGGLITTKPYFCGSSYIRKMSNYSRGRWCEIWDGLYWRWIFKHQESLASHPRWAMMCAQARKMEPAKRELHLANAERYLAGLFSNAG